MDRDRGKDEVGVAGEGRTGELRELQREARLVDDRFPEIHVGERERERALAWMCQRRDKREIIRGEGNCRLQLARALRRAGTD